MVDERSVAGADRRHLDDLAPDQLDPIGRLEDTHLAHAVVLLAREPASRRRHLDRHRLLPIDQRIAGVAGHSEVPERIRARRIKEWTLTSARVRSYGEPWLIFTSASR